jgi:hypothetical protein
MNLQEIIDYVRQNVTLKERIDELTSVQSDVKKNLKQGIEELGEVDDRGHVVIDLGQEVGGIRKVMHQKRVSKNLDIEIAERILNEKNLHDRCVTMVPVLDEAEIMAAYYEGLITEEDIDTMFPAKVTWALVMTKS